MTPEEHNKALGICHLVYGGLSTLLMFAMFIFIWFFFSALPEGGPPVGIMLVFMAFMLIYSFIFTLPSFIAGYALLKHKPWARTASLIAAVLEAMSVPVGTAVSVYSFWFMFSDAGKQLYDKAYVPAGQRYALGDSPPPPVAEWGHRATQEREREYVPPAQPPDWRG